MKKALLIAEKGSLKRTIENVYNKHKSEIPYDITFTEQSGHLLTLLNPSEMDEDMKTWSFDNLPFHPEEHGGWQYKVIQAKKTGNYQTPQEKYEHIKKELSSGKYDCVINAGDADQEGELLVRIVLKQLKCNLPILRFWSNDLTEGKVLEALQNLRDDEHDEMLVNLLAAAYGRQHSDYRFGMNISRAASIKMNSRAACGRVKTPILSIVCKREKEIENFVPKTNYGVTVNYSEGFNGQLFENNEEDDNDKKEDEQSGIVWVETKEEAEDLIEKLSSVANIIKFEEKEVKTQAPKLFKLATAQIAAGKLGYNSDKTLSIIQGLYEHGYLSYPRTTCEYISSNENLSALLKSAASVPELSSYVANIDSTAIGRVKKYPKWVNDEKLQEAGHTALVPTSKKPDFDSLSKEEKDIYTLVCRQFVSIFMPPLVQKKTLLIADVDGNLFKSTGKTLVDKGFTEIFNTTFKDNEIPFHTSGDILNVNNFEVSEKTTTCPKRFTDADLIAVCEAPHKFLEDKSLKELGKRLKIGTPATRSSIIKELIEKDKYLQTKVEKKTTYVVPSDEGMVIYDNLKDFNICKVDMTGEWEEKLEDVRLGKMTLAELEDFMMEDVRSMVKEIETSQMTAIMKSKRQTIGTCPKCGKDLMAGQKSYYCAGYKEGCNLGAFNKICDSKLKPEEFIELVNGNNITKTIKKGSSSWEQELYYDFNENKIQFVKKEYSNNSKESNYCCPNCGEVLKETDRLLKCSCGFTFWKTVGSNKKELSEDEIANFFRSGETGFIDGLKGKNGKDYSANFVLSDDKMGTKMVFQNN